MKRLVFTLLYRLGVPALFRFLHKNSLTIVLYHGVAPASNAGSIFNYRGKFISPGSFEKQVAYFARHYRVLPLDTALEQLASGTLPHNALAITFDDGYENFYTYAFPTLKRAKMTATVFLTTDFVIRKTPLWVDRLEYACGKRPDTQAENIAFDAKTRDELKTCTPAEREARLRSLEQDAAGVPFSDFDGDRAVYAPLTQAEILHMQDSGISFGAHTQSHPILSRMTRQEQEREISGSHSDLTDIGIRVSPVFAYPNGHPSDWNTDTEDVLRTGGFTHALTTLEGTNSPATAPYRLHRMVLDDTRQFAKFATVVSGARLFFKSIM